jgi:hypothetical protein
MRLGHDGRALGLRLTGAVAIAFGIGTILPGCGSDSNTGFPVTGGQAGAGAEAGTGNVGGGQGGTGNVGGGQGGTGNVGGGQGGTGNVGGGQGGTGNVGGTAGCPSGQAECDGTCTNTQYDPNNCGNCGVVCGNGEYCSQGTCSAQCLGSKLCDGACVNTNTDPDNCGDCGTKCSAPQVCSVGICDVTCVGGTIKCGTDCANLQNDPNNCGQCGKICPGGQVCSAGQCAVSCSTPYSLCGNLCVDTKNDKNNCGQCGTVCPGAQACLNGTCNDCDPVNQDCDGDGWAGSVQGDCCEMPGICGANPALINPGALEVVGNGIDDNCNGKTDLFDKEDTLSCDGTLASDSSVGTDYAKALGLCRVTVENPPLKKDKSWGLIEAKLMRADGTPLGDARAKSIRPKFGDVIKPVEGSSLVVLSSGIAADGTQTSPGPIAGASTTHNPGSSVSLSACTDALCIKDWYSVANSPLKAANQYPQAPGCGSATSGNANDSVCLYLKIRAPTNVRAFSFNSYFFSSEFPEYVCSNYNDQYVALVHTDTPTAPIPNPVDKNLMTYIDPATQSRWPIGINMAGPGTGGTNLFAVCDPRVTQSGSLCYDSSVNTQSCSMDIFDLAGTGFGASSPGGCPVGGGTFWRTTSGNVNPGQIVTLRLCTFDVGDSILDSLSLIDGFSWLANATLPGTG